MNLKVPWSGALQTRNVQLVKERLIERFGLDLWQRYYPRCILTPEGYVRHEYVGISLLIYDTQACLKEVPPPGSGNRRVLTSAAVISRQLRPVRFPSWFVSEELALALLQTELPREMPLSVLRFPMPALILRFPSTDRFYAAAGGRYMPFLAATRSTDPGGTIPYVTAMASVQDRSYDLAEMSVTYPDTDTVGQVVDGSLSVDDAWSAKTVDLPPAEELIARDKGSTQVMLQLLIGTLAVMEARPELVETENKPCRPARAKDDKPELWNPNFVGRTYQAHRPEPQVGTHASPRLHWRRGHLRNQPHGPGRTLRKMIWLEPVLISGPDNPAP